jgi:phosphoribosyl-AMP cyclohydrolase
MTDDSSEGGFAALLGDVAFGPTGLVPAIVQDAASRDVLMLGYMDAEALRRTLTSGRTWFFSRSRQQLWAKGETSGSVQRVRRMLIDCDRDAIVVEVEQQGSGACHTGAWSCFEERFVADR